MKEQVWAGIDGADILGFMAALGAFRVVSAAQPGVRLAWKAEGPFWRPCLHSKLSPDDVLLCLAAAMADRAAAPEFTNMLGSEIRVESGKFHAWLQVVAGTAAEPFAAAWGVPGRQKTDVSLFHTMAGPQHFLAALKKLAESIDPVRDFHEALFGPWQRAHAQNSFGWDPSQGAPYAYRLGRSADAAPTSVRGALWLMVEALPFFPVVGSRGQTTGFVRLGLEDEQSDYFRWPIWEGALSPATVRTLVASDLTPGTRTPGLWSVYQSERAKEGYYGRFRHATMI